MKADEQRVVDAVPTSLYVDGTWRPADSGATFPVHDPSTGEVACEIADAAVEDGKAALSAAETLASWTATAPRERAKVLRRGYEELTARVDGLPLLMTLEMGKPVADSRGEIAYAAELLRWFSEEACRIEGSCKIAPAGDTGMLMMRQPVGRACSSRRGTSRWRWAPARSGPRSRQDATGRRSSEVRARSR